MENKGFSMVELIIVIAIMAILAGALAPALIKYINKARLSSDISSGRELASAIMTAVTSDAAYNGAEEHSTPYPVDNMGGADFKSAVSSIYPIDDLKPKSKRDIDGNPITNRTFYYTLDADKNKVEVYYGGTTADYQIYPVTGSKLVK